MSFQIRVGEWGREAFGVDLAFNRQERVYRFLEEALELAQALDCSKEDALKLVDYVFGRPTGEIHQEIGGVMVTLALLCEAEEVRDMNTSGEDELKRCWANIDAIRAKQKTKTIRSPLPGKAV